MGKTEKIESFKNKSKEEKLEILSSILDDFKNSKNIFHDIYESFSKNKDYLDEELLIDVYSTILKMFEEIEEQRLGERVSLVETLQSNIQDIREKEDQEKDGEEDEVEDFMG